MPIHIYENNNVFFFYSSDTNSLVITKFSAGLMSLCISNVRSFYKLYLPEDSVFVFPEQPFVGLGRIMIKHSAGLEVRQGQRMYERSYRVNCHRYSGIYTYVYSQCSDDTASFGRRLHRMAEKPKCSRHNAVDHRLRFELERNRHRQIYLPKVRYDE